MDSSTTALARTAANAPLPHLAEISAHFTPAKWAECIDSMIELAKSGSEIVKVRAFEALTKVLEISEAARVASRQKPPMRGGMLSLNGDVNINIPGGDGDEIDAVAHARDELDDMRQRALDAIGSNGQTD